MKEYLKTLWISLSTLLFILIIFKIAGITIGDNSHDFGKQHVKFIEYIRNLIFATGDLKPQMTMNYGLGQSFVTLYYHGLYNPFVMFSLILGPYVSIKLVMYFIYSLIIGLSSVGMHWLARLNKFSHFQSRIISMLSTFSGLIIFHFSWHPMFIYYYPFMILSLVSLHYLVEKKNVYFYSLALGMVFYTNFFFAPIASIIQFLYFIGLLIDKGESFQLNIWNYVKGYITGVLLGSLFLIPVYLFASEGVRGGNPIITGNTFNEFGDTMFNLLNYKYVSGIGVVSLFGLFYGLITPGKKRYFLPLLFLAATLVFSKLVLLLNLNMYHEFKYFINFIPLLWLVTGEYLFKEKINWKKILVPMICIILIIFTKEDDIEMKRKVILIVETIILTLAALNKENMQFTTVVAMVIIVASIALNIISVKDDLYLEATLSGSLKMENKDLSQETKVEPYRNLEPDINALSSLTSFNPNIYTSLENGNYENMINKYLELECADPSRYHRDTVFDNYLIRNYLGIKKDTKGSINDVNPMVYGVSNKDAYNLDTLKAMDKDERLLAVNAGIFVAGESSEYKEKISPKLIYSSNKQYSMNKEKGKKTFDIPKEYQRDGLFRISANANIPDKSTQAENIEINKHLNMARKNDYYGPAMNSELTYLIDSSKNLKKFKLIYDRVDNSEKKFTYDDLKVEYFDLNSIQKNKLKTSLPKNFRVNMSHSYKFDIEQKDAGYLATTIPYDKGFEIKVDGQVVDKVKINGLFLGTKLSQGMHSVEISYTIPGFKLGLILTSLGLMIIILGELKYFKMKKNTRRK